MKTFFQFSEDVNKLKQYQVERQQRRRTPAEKRADPDLAKLTYMLNLDRPGR